MKKEKSRPSMLRLLVRDDATTARVIALLLCFTFVLGVISMLDIKALVVLAEALAKLVHGR